MSGAREEQGRTAAPPADPPSSLKGGTDEILDFRFEVNQEAIQAVLSLAREWAGDRGVAPEDIASLRLVLEELLLNIAFHASPLPPSPRSGAIRAELLLALYPLSPDASLPGRGFPPPDGISGDRSHPWSIHHGRRIFLQIRDNGRAFNPLEHVAAPMGPSPGETAPGGLGISLVRLLAVRATHTRVEDGNVLSLFLPLGEQSSSLAGPPGDQGAARRRRGLPRALPDLWGRSLALRQTVFWGLIALVLCWVPFFLFLQTVRAERQYAAWVAGRQAVETLDLLTSRLFVRLRDNVQGVARNLDRGDPDPRLAFLPGSAEQESLLAALLHFPVGGVLYAKDALPGLILRREGPPMRQPDILFQAPSAAGEPAWQGPIGLFSESSPLPALFFRLPWKLPATGREAPETAASGGTVGIILFLPELAGFLKSLTPLPEAEIFLLDAEGRYLLFPPGREAGAGPANIFADAELSGNDALESLAQAMFSGRTGSMKLAGEARRAFPWKTPWEEPLTVLYRPLQIEGWSLGLLAPSRLLGDDTPPFPGLLILLVVAGPALFLFLVWRTASQALKPMQDLTVSLEAMAHGDLDSPLPAPAHPDEIGAMLLSFERARLTLRATLRTLLFNTRIRNRLAGEFRLARSLQESLLLTRFPRLPRTDVCARVDMAGEVCGDFYDCFLLEGNRLCCVLGDVSGTGVPAAILMNGAVSLTREALLAGLDPAAALARVNTALLRSSLAAMFVTMLVGILEEESGLFTWASAGHPAPMRAWPREKGPAGEENVLCLPWPGELALGIRPAERYSLFFQPLLPGEALLLYSDGAEEAAPRNSAPPETGEFFGEKRLAASLARHIAAPSAAAHLEGIRTDLLAHMAGTPPHDDITLLVLRRRESPPSGDNPGKRS
ncbi:MAG: SpoIIE family protein phosphatase [Desulfovibrio sp.]|jgi:serine phosphatase RsbU (regulator of sigma subunit)/anti-sigma regulatory factor (Ser/Thr protein kinase)|nr:SpoIIE family protein phosphatase [Desulfovibrio sp.]